MDTAAGFLDHLFQWPTSNHHSAELGISSLVRRTPRLLCRLQQFSDDRINQARSFGRESVPSKVNGTKDRRASRLYDS